MSVRLKAIDLADLLGVAQATVSGAAINDHLCRGYPVSEWADKNTRGRILGYNVPDEIFRDLKAGEVNEKLGEKDVVPSKGNRTNTGSVDSKEEQLEEFGEAMELQWDLDEMEGETREGELTKEEQFEVLLKKLGITEDEADQMTLSEYFNKSDAN